MSNDSIDRVAVVLKLTKDVEFNCYPPVKDFFNILLQHVTGEAQGTFGDVVLSGQPPSSDDIYKLWIAINGQRNQFENRFFINGKWVTWQFVAENEIRFFDGRATLPEGWQKIGEFKVSDVPVTDLSGNGSLPATIIVARWVGF